MAWSKHLIRPSTKDVRNAYYPMREWSRDERDLVFVTLRLLGHGRVGGPSEGESGNWLSEGSRYAYRCDRCAHWFYVKQSETVADAGGTIATCNGGA